MTTGNANAAQEQVEGLARKLAVDWEKFNPK